MGRIGIGGRPLHMTMHRSHCGNRMNIDCAELSVSVVFTKLAIVIESSMVSFHTTHRAILRDSLSPTSTLSALHQPFIASLHSHRHLTYATLC